MTSCCNSNFANKTKSTVPRKSINSSIDNYVHKLGIPVAVFVNLDSFLLKEDKESIETDFNLLSVPGYNDNNQKLALFIDYCFVESTTKRTGNNPDESRNLLTGETVMLNQEIACNSTTGDPVPSLGKQSNKLDAGCLVPTKTIPLFQRCVNQAI